MPGKKEATISLVLLLIFLTPSGGSAEVSSPTRGEGMNVYIVSPSDDEVITGVYDLEIFAESDGSVVNYVSIQISEDNSTWKMVDFLDTTDPENRYVISINSSLYSDGDYYFKIRVRDDSGNSTEVFMGPVELWNPDPPHIIWSSPKFGDVIQGEPEITVICGDYDGDLVDGLHLSISPVGLSNLLLDVLYEHDAQDRFHYILNTWDFPDGEYILIANVSTTYGYTLTSESPKFFIDNEYAPVVNIHSPSDPESLTGTVVLSADLADLDENVNSKGVEFFYSFQGSDAKVKIGGDPDPDGGYQVEWDTEKVKNGNYTIFAEAWDEGDPRQKGQDQINVKVLNLPEALSLENIGRMEDGWHVLLTMKRIPMAYPVVIGISIRYHIDYTPWIELTLTQPMDEVRPNIFDLTIPVNRLPEGNISVRIEINDVFGMGDDIEALELFYFFPLIPPQVTLIEPEEEHLSGSVWIFAEVIDDEDPIPNPVYFHYSKDNSSWSPLGEGVFSSGNRYKVLWDTSEVVDNDHYHIRANYTDSTGLSAESYLKDISTWNDEQVPPEDRNSSRKWYQETGNLLFLAAVAVFIGVVAAIFLVTTRTVGKRIRKRRESEERKRQEEDRRRKLDKERKIRDREMDDLIRHKSVRDITGKPANYVKPSGAVPLRPGEKGMGGDQIGYDSTPPPLEDLEFKPGPVNPPPTSNLVQENPAPSTLLSMFQEERVNPEEAISTPIDQVESETDGYHIECRCGGKVWIPSGSGYFSFKCESCGRAGRVLR